MLLSFLWSGSAHDIHVLFKFLISVPLVPLSGLLSVIVVFPGHIGSFMDKIFVRDGDGVQAQWTTKEKLEDLQVLRRSPDLLNNVKIGQGQLQLIWNKFCFTIYILVK